MSKHIKVLTLAWLAVLCAAYPAAFASSGTAAFQFLRLDNGARETALGGAATAAGDATQGVFYNPALISGLSYSNEFSFYNSAWLADINYQNFAYSHQFANKKDYLGARYQNLAYGTFTGHDAAGGKTSDYTSGSRLLGFTYGRALPNRVYVGVALKEAWERIQDARANALLMDAGVVIKTDWYQSVWGVAVRNIGQDIKYDSDWEHAPVTFAFGCAIKPVGNLFMLSADSEMTQEQGAGVKLGAEANYHKLLYLRGGWDSFVNAGAGLRVGFGLAIKNISVDYAFLPMSVFGNTHHFGIKWAFDLFQVNATAQKETEARGRAAPEAVALTPEITVSAPENVISAPEVVALAPEITVSAPEAIVSAPEVELPAQTVEVIAEPDIPVLPVTVSSRTIKSLPAPKLKSAVIKTGKSTLNREPQPSGIWVRARAVLRSYLARVIAMIRGFFA